MPPAWTLPSPATCLWIASVSARRKANATGNDHQLRTKPRRVGWTSLSFRGRSLGEATPRYNHSAGEAVGKEDRRASRTGPDGIQIAAGLQRAVSSAARDVAAR